MSETLRLGIAGLGTVGSGVIEIIQQHGDMLKNRAGRGIEITCVSARDKGKDRGVDISAYHWVDNAADLATREDVDIIVELIGGSDGLAYDTVKKALQNGKDVVTANKALLAHHGVELSTLADANGCALMYEAAVAGGIPAIKSLREALGGNAIKGVYGILNGTCNYMLSAMRETGKDFDVILKEAQELGYAEADPTFDIDGIDSAHKLCLLSGLAFGVQPDFEQLQVTGIRQINATDIAFANELGYRIKLLGIAAKEQGRLVQLVEPCLVPVSNPLGMIEDVYNAVYLDGDFVETVLLTGKGAGKGPTASAVLSDIIDLARGKKLPAFGVPAKQLQKADWMAPEDMVSSYYIRLNVLDQPGVIADISAILRDHDISIESLIQRARDPDKPVPIVLTTHETRRGAIQDACENFAKLDSVADQPCLIRIEGLE